MTCFLCDSRKAKRFCPAVRTQICPQCCGKEREETLDCPLECPYLQEGREHEKPAGLDPSAFPYQEIQVTEKFLRDHEDLLTATAQFTLGAAFQAPGAVDRDVRDALDALVRTYKTLESGVYYQTMPQSPIAGAIVAQLQQALQQFRQQDAERTGVTRTRDTDVLGVLIFLLRMALHDDNGRRLGKSFLHNLYRHFQPTQPTPSPSPLIVPG